MSRLSINRRGASFFRRRPAANTPGTPRLKVLGDKIVRVDNNAEVILRGANFLRYEWDGSTNAETTLIPKMRNEWGGNIVMLGYAADPVLNNSNHIYGGNYRSLIDSIVATCKTNDVYIVIAFRSYGINGPQATDIPDQRAQDSLAFLADRYKSEEHVMFACQVETNGSVSWTQARDFYTSCVAAIHGATVPIKPIVMTSGLDWGRNINGAITNPVAGENVVYKTHPYGVQASFQGWFGEAVDAGLPVFIGEFGQPVHGMEQVDVQAILDYCRPRKIGYTAWMFDYQGGPAMITSNTTASPTIPYGQSVKASMLATPVNPGDPEAA